MFLLSYHPLDCESIAQHVVTAVTKKKHGTVTSKSVQIITLKNLSNVKQKHNRATQNQRYAKVK